MAGSGGGVPVLGREGLSLRVKAAVHHADQVVLAERPLCQGHGSQTGWLHTRQNAARSSRHVPTSVGRGEEKKEGAALPFQ